MGTRNLFLAVEHLEARRLMSAYYVSLAGSDAAGGAEATPFKTLQKAANVVKAGDTVNVGAGTYVGFNLTTSGTAAAPITFKAEKDVVINSRNSETADGINVEGANYVVIDGFTVDNSGGSITRAGIRCVTNDHAVIRNNKIEKAGTWGIFTAFSENVLIENNVASNSKAEHGIYVSNSADNPTIRGNTLYGNARCGLHMNGDADMGGDGVISGALVEANVIYGNGRDGGSGINCDGVRNSTIQNNVLFDNHSSGISLYRIDGGASSTGNVVANNTVLVASDGRWALNIQDGSTGNAAYNNILLNANAARGSIDISDDSRSGFVSDYNVLADKVSNAESFQSVVQWQAASGQDVHSFVATPTQLFANPAANDYRLSAASPALDKGTATKAPKTDRLGTTRPSGGAVDIGAFELSTGASSQPAPAPAPTPAPATQPPQAATPASPPALVGPRWYASPLPPWIYMVRKLHTRPRAAT